MFKLDPNKHDERLEFEPRRNCPCGQFHKSSVHCSFCGASVKWASYGDHVERHRKANFQPAKMATRTNKVIVFAEALEGIAYA